MTEPTQGPWHWWDRNDKPNPRPKKYDLAHLAGDGRIILSMYGGEGDNALGESPEDKANSRLLARAWEMRELCKEAAEVLFECETNGDLWDRLVALLNAIEGD